MKYKKIDKNLVGFMRATEITVNQIDNSYNQHMHVLLCVESTYFKNTENYVDQKQWTAFWKRAMKLDYDLVVDIRAIKPKNKEIISIHALTRSATFEDFDISDGHTISIHALTRSATSF